MPTAPRTPTRTPLRLDSRDRAPWLTAVVGLGLIGSLYLRLAGLPGADLHGPLHHAGIMDPFCGGTRATYVLVHGDLAAAWSWNPLVPLLAAAAAAIAVRAVAGTTTGRWLTVDLRRRTWALAIASLLIVIEVNQQLQAARLMDVVPT